MSMSMSMMMQPFVAAIVPWNVWSTEQGSTNVLNRLDSAFTLTEYTTSFSGYHYGMVFDGTYIWISNEHSDYVSKYDLNGNFITACSLPVSTAPMGLAFDGTYIWSANLNGTVCKISLAWSLQNTFTVSGTPAFQYIAFDGTDMWLTDYSTNKIVKMDSAGTPTIYSGPTGWQPSAIAFDGTDMWFCNYQIGKISKMTLAGVRTDYTIGWNPWWIAFDGTNMWAVDHVNGAINIVNSAGTVIDTFLGAWVNPLNIAYDGTYMWLSETVWGNIYYVDSVWNMALYPVWGATYGIVCDNTLLTHWWGGS